jgi:hypothetical protein
MSCGSRDFASRTWCGGHQGGGEDSDGRSRHAHRAGAMPQKLWPYLFGGCGGADRRLFVAAESTVRLAEAAAPRQVMPEIVANKLLKFNLGVGTKGARTRSRNGQKRSRKTLQREE